MLRWIAGVVLLLVVAAVGWQWWRAINLPALARDLPSEHVAAETEFKRRVTTRFPIGSAEADLVHELEAQGFPVARQARTATVETFNLVCRTFWTVAWEVDGTGRLAALRPLHFATCL